VTQKCGVTRLSALAATGMVALSGCGSEEAATEKATAAPTRAQSATVPEQLVGIWTRKVAGRTSKWVAPGVVSMKVDRDGNVEIYEAGTDPASECLTEEYCWAMVIRARDGKLIIGDTPACEDQATYSYKITADKLITELVKDDCADQRPPLFDGTTWRREP
jgi:hypothetical protein